MTTTSSTVFLCFCCAEHFPVDACNIGLDNYMRCPFCHETCPVEDPCEKP